MIQNIGLDLLLFPLTRLGLLTAASPRLQGVYGSLGTRAPSKGSGRVEEAGPCDHSHPVCRAACHWGQQLQRSSLLSCCGWSTRCSPVWRNSTAQPGTCFSSTDPLVLFGAVASYTTMWLSSDSLAPGVAPCSWVLLIQWYPWAKALICRCAAKSIV